MPLAPPCRLKPRLSVSAESLYHASRAVDCHALTVLQAQCGVSAADDRRDPVLAGDHRGMRQWAPDIRHDCGCNGEEWCPGGRSQRGHPFTTTWKGRGATCPIHARCSSCSRSSMRFTSQLSKSGVTGAEIHSPNRKFRLKKPGAGASQDQTAESPVIGLACSR
jgi:hypothetical protein